MKSRSSEEFLNNTINLSKARQVPSFENETHFNESDLPSPQQEIESASNGFFNGKGNYFSSGPDHLISLSHQSVPSENAQPNNVLFVESEPSIDKSKASSSKKKKSEEYLHDLSLMMGSSKQQCEREMEHVERQLNALQEDMENVQAQINHVDR